MQTWSWWTWCAASRPALGCVLRVISQGRAGPVQCSTVDLFHEVHLAASKTLGTLGSEGM